MPERTCPWCDAAVIGRAAKRYCSTQCQQAANRAAYRQTQSRGPEALAASYRCGRCGEVKPGLDFAPSARTTGAYCRLCNRAYQRERYQTADRKCRRCEEVFVPWSKAKHPGQAGSHCQECYNALKRESYDRRHWNNVAPRPTFTRLDYDPVTKKRPAGRKWQDLRLRVIAEESDCWLCGEPVDKSLKGPSRRSPSVDHVVPLSLGGDYWDRSNLHLAHYGCNASRGGGSLLVEAQALIGQLRGRVAELEAEVAWLRQSGAA